MMAQGCLQAILRQQQELSQPGTMLLHLTFWSQIYRGIGLLQGAHTAGEAGGTARGHHGS